MTKGPRVFLLRGIDSERMNTLFVELLIKDKKQVCSIRNHIRKINLV